MSGLTCVSGEGVKLVSVVKGLNIVSLVKGLTCVIGEGVKNCVSGEGLRFLSVVNSVVKGLKLCLW